MFCGKTCQLKLKCYLQLCTAIIINAHAKVITQVELHLDGSNVRRRVSWNNLLNEFSVKPLNSIIYASSIMTTQYNLLLHPEIGRTNAVYL